MNNVEFWALRVLMHAGPPHGPMRLTDPEGTLPASVLARIDSQELACIPPDWCIAEPVAGPFDTEAEAQQVCEQLRRDNPGADIRCVLNADADGGA